jgi:hypothetical protein
LTYVGAGFSAGATLQGRNSTNTANISNTTAPSTFGSYTYYAAATKTLNSNTRYSNLMSVVVNVVQTWVATTPTYMAWTNSGALYDCTNWTPDPSTVNSGTTFTQNATNCNQAQTRTRQDREQETTTSEIRNVGVEVTENQTLTNQPSSRTATGTKVTAVCLYDESFNPNIFIWYESSGGGELWSSPYSSVPQLSLFIPTMESYFYEKPAGLTKISNTEIRYAAPGKTWKITRGAYVRSESKQLGNKLPSI